MKDNYKVTMKSGEVKIYRNYASMVKFVINNYDNVKTTNDNITNILFK